MDRTPTKRFQVHIYKHFTAPGVLTFDLQVQATECAARQFERPDVYKVRVWDTEQGPIDPSELGTAGLILELI